MPLFQNKKEPDRIKIEQDKTIVLEQAKEAMQNQIIDPRGH